MTLLLDWQVKLNAILLSSTRTPGRPVLSEAEFDEMVDAFSSGKTPEEFAGVIQERDRDRTRTPLDFPKPLTEEHQRIINLLREHYDHTDRPVLLSESEHYATVRIPKVGAFRSGR